MNKIVAHSKWEGMVGDVFVETRVTVIDLHTRWSNSFWFMLLEAVIGKWTSHLRDLQATRGIPRSGTRAVVSTLAENLQSC